jgi:hypothetical protein
VVHTDGSVWGIIDTGCAEHPNLGKPGMLLELDSVDAEGIRSSAGYSYSGFKSNLASHLALLASGQWQSGAKTDPALAVLAVGVPDLWYKLDHGYRSYSHGEPEGMDRSSDTSRFNYPYLRSLWDDVVKPYHRL